MKIKEQKLDQSPLNQFDLLGSDEVGLSKAFAYLMGKEPAVLYEFLHKIGVATKNTRLNFNLTSVEVEKSRSEGRTDIEIRQQKKFHVIIESKVGNNKVITQRTQYLSSFDKNSSDKKVLCFITGINDFSKELAHDINIYNMSWLEVGDMLESKKFINIPLVQDFLSFIKKGYNMREQKEILVQDLGNSEEINKYKKHQVYRRDVVFGSPLYFAPYFTRTSGESEGISSLSRIVGILSLNPKDIENYCDELNKFCHDQAVVENWKCAVKKDAKNPEDKKYTYFFLDEPLELDVSLRKDGGNKKGRGKNWIAAMIPRNRCVSFQEFTKRLMDEKNKQKN